LPTKKTKKNAGKSLVIVESPAKARTLSGILGSEYDIRSSVGHVRDLPKSRLGVDVDAGFAPRYIVPKEKKAVVDEIKKAAAGAGQIFLATDPDREGEAISWHLVEAAELQDQPHQRVVFHEITPEAVKEAFRHPRPIDTRLVDAQQARRVLDRLVGYQVSPILWKKIRRGLSAGRVQSVALRMVVEREREIQAFVPQEYWTIDVDLTKPQADADAFTARLAGLLPKKKIEINNREHAEQISGALREAEHKVQDVKKRPQTRRPAAPFTTSTLQQDASRRLGFSAKRTMALAQQLYEGITLPGEGQVGLITYMRTDSTNIAESAREEARNYITTRYGADYLPEKPRQYKKGKLAQEAHEAIRPTSAMREPSMISKSLHRDQLRLYTLVWQRFLASQMADAIYDQTTIEVESHPREGHDRYLLRATESVVRFAGFQQLYRESSDDETEEEQPAKKLPELSAGDELRATDVRPDQHFTEPPPRYTEASLVKALEENGIGRPSTYAPILSTLQDRGYVHREGRALIPQELGFVVNDMLIEHFADVFDPTFTATMEEELDEVARGEIEWEPVVRQFYDPLQAKLANAAEAPRVEEVTDVMCEKCGKPMIKRWGRFGQFLACSGFPECKSTRPIDEEEAAAEATDEVCGECGSPMIVKTGRFGRFLACSRYPDCKGTKPILTKVGVNCPKCGGDIVERRTRQRRIFYGCSKYPECDFTSWSRPLEQPCPQCGGLIVNAGGVRNPGAAKCTACDWKGTVGESEPELVEATA
jgi:DNA topoisomerase-1